MSEKLRISKRCLTNETGTILKTNYGKKISPISCWSLQLSHCRPKLRPEPAVFQLLYERSQNSQNFYLNSFRSEIRVAVANAKSFHPNILHFDAVVVDVSSPGYQLQYRRTLISRFLCVHVNTPNMIQTGKVHVNAVNPTSDSNPDTSDFWFLHYTFPPERAPTSNQWALKVLRGWFLARLDSPVSLV